MELSELKQLAYDKTGNPSVMSSFDRAFYFEASTLYDSVRRGSLSNDEGVKKMIHLELIYERDRSDSRQCSEIAQLWKRIEPPAKAYWLDATIDNADRFYAAVYDLPKDWRLKR